MGALNVRNLEEKVQRALRVRAAQSGRSMEAEAREILTAATLGQQSKAGAPELQAMVDRLYRDQPRPVGVVDELIRERRREAEAE
jgi:plasmid stability protein